MGYARREVWSKKTVNSNHFHEQPFQAQDPYYDAIGF
jgi:hypothetical protein